MDKPSETEGNEVISLREQLQVALEKLDEANFLKDDLEEQLQGACAETEKDLEEQIAKLQIQVKDLHQENESLKAEIKKHRDNRKEYKRIANTLQIEIVDLKSRCEMLESDLAAQRDENTSKDSMFEESLSLADSLRSEIAALQSKLHESESTLDTLRDQVTTGAYESQQHIVGLQDIKSNLVSSFNEIQEQLEEVSQQFQDTTESLTKVREEKESVEQQLLESHVDLTQMESTVQSLQNEIVDLKSRCEMLESDLAAQRDENTSKDSMLEESLSLADSLRSEIAALQSKFHDLSSFSEFEISSLNEQIGILQQNIMNLEDRLARKQIEYDQLQSDLLQEMNCLMESKLELEHEYENYKRENEEILSQKNLRIEHLEKFQLTKEHRDRIKQWKDGFKKKTEENERMMQQFLELKNAYEELKNNRAASSTRVSSYSDDNCEGRKFGNVLNNGSGNTNGGGLPQKKRTSVKSKISSESTSAIEE